MADSKSKHQVEISAVDKATPVIKGIEGAFKNLGAFVGGAAVVGAFAKATQAAIDFEQGLAKTATLLPAASRNMDVFSEGLKKIHRTGISKSLGELTEGLYETVSAGIPAGNALEFMNTAAKTAKGGFTDVRTAVDGLTTVLNAYQLSADQANHVADVMFVTQNRGKVTIGEMAGSLGQILPIASSVGVSFEEISAAISTLTVKGIPAALAITGLRATIAAFIERGDAGKLKTLGLAGALKDLEMQTGGSALKLQDYLGRVEALNTVSALTGSSTQQFAADLAAIKDSAGAADEAVKAFTDNAAGRLDKLKGVAQVFAVEVGQAFADNLVSEKQVSALEKNLSTASNAFGLFGANVVGALLEPVALLTKLLDMAGNVSAPVVAGAQNTWSSWSTWGDKSNSTQSTVRPHGWVDPFEEMIKNTPTDEYSRRTRIKNALSAEENRVLGGIFTAGLVISDALNTVAQHIANWGPTIMGSRFGEGRGIISPFGSSRGGIGMQAGRGGGRLSGGLFDTQFNAGNVPHAENSFELPMQGLSKLEERILQIAPVFQQMMSAVTNTIVQGLMTGKGQIVDVLNALKGAILSILAQIAAKMAVIGLISLIPGAGTFSSVGKFLGGGLFSMPGGNGPRVPVGASAASGFGGGGMRITLVVQGDLVNSDEKIRRFINAGVQQAQRGQNNLSRYLGNN